MSTAQVRQSMQRLAAVRTVARMKGDDEMAAKADAQLKRLRESVSGSPDMRSASEGYAQLRKVKDMGPFGRFASGAKEAAIDTGLAGAQMIGKLLPGVSDSPMIPAVANLDDALTGEARDRAMDNRALNNTLGGQLGMGGLYTAPWLFSGGLSSLATGPRMAAMAGLGAVEGAATQPVMPGQNFAGTKAAQMGVGGAAAFAGELPLAAMGSASRRAAGNLLEATVEDAAVLGTRREALLDPGENTSSSSGRGGAEATIEVNAPNNAPSENDWSSIEPQLRAQLREEGIDLTQANTQGLQRVRALQQAGIPLTSAEIEYVASGGRTTKRFSAQQTAERVAGTDLQQELTALKRLRDDSVESLLRRPEYGGRAADEVGEDLEYVLLSNLRERREAEQAAWDRVDPREDMEVFNPEEREQILSRLYQVLVDERISVTEGESSPLRQFMNNLENNLGVEQSYTLGGVSNLRKDINAFYGNADPGSNSQRVMGEVRREYDRALDDLLGRSEASGKELVPFDPDSMSRSEGISLLREAVGASRRTNQLTRNTTRTTDRRNQKSVLSQALADIESGAKTPATVLDSLLAGRGSKALRLIDEAYEVLGDSGGGQVSGMVRDAALRQAINAKIVGRGTAINLRTRDGLKALGDSILNALETKAELFDTLLGPDELYTLTQVANGLRDLQPSQNLANWSNSAGTFTSLLNMVRKIPGGGRLVDGPVAKVTLGAFAEAEAESSARREIGLPDGVAGTGGGREQAGESFFNEKFALGILQMVDDLDGVTSGARGGIGAGAGLTLFDDDETE